MNAILARRSAFATLVACYHNSFANESVAAHSREYIRSVLNKATVEEAKAATKLDPRLTSTDAGAIAIGIAKRVSTNEKAARSFIDVELSEGSFIVSFDKDVRPDHVVSIVSQIGKVAQICKAGDKIAEGLVSDLLILAVEPTQDVSEGLVADVKTSIEEGLLNTIAYRTKNAAKALLYPDHHVVTTSYSHEPGKNPKAPSADVKLHILNSIAKRTGGARWHAAAPGTSVGDSERGDDAERSQVHHMFKNPTDAAKFREKVNVMPGHKASAPRVTKKHDAYVGESTHDDNDYLDSLPQRTHVVNLKFRDGKEVSHSVVASGTRQACHWASHQAEAMYNQNAGRGPLARVISATCGKTSVGVDGLAAYHDGDVIGYDRSGLINHSTRLRDAHPHDWRMGYSEASAKRADQAYSQSQGVHESLDEAEGTFKKHAEFTTQDGKHAFRAGRNTTEGTWDDRHYTKTDGGGMVHVKDHGYDGHDSKDDATAAAKAACVHYDAQIGGIHESDEESAHVQIPYKPGHYQFTFKTAKGPEGKSIRRIVKGDNMSKVHDEAKAAALKDYPASHSHVCHAPQCESVVVLEAKLHSDVEDSMADAGMDGRKLYASPGEGWSALHGALAKHGLAIHDDGLLIQDHGDHYAGTHQLAKRPTETVKDPEVIPGAFIHVQRASGVGDREGADGSDFPMRGRHEFTAYLTGKKLKEGTGIKECFVYAYGDAAWATLDESTRSEVALAHMMRTFASPSARKSVTGNGTFDNVFSAALASVRGHDLNESAIEEVAFAIHEHFDDINALAAATVFDCGVDVKRPLAESADDKATLLKSIASYLFLSEGVSRKEAAMSLEQLVAHIKTVTTKSGV